VRKDRPLYFLIAGEASGDLLGADLMRDLKAQHQGKIDFIGIGGPKMTAAGIQSLFPMDELSIIGLLGVFRNLKNLLGRIKQAIQAIKTSQPDVVITIDAPDFSFRVAKAIAKWRQGATPQLIHYVAPTVWAWRPGRAKKIAQIYDELYCLYPFEPPYFEKHGLKTTFVGHPLAREPEGDAKRFYEKSGIPEGTPILTLLPGSRKSEVTRLLPLFMEAADQFLATRPNYQVVIPTVPYVEGMVKEMTQDWKVKPYIFMGDEMRRDAFAASKVALAASGTVALELGLSGVPFAIAYKLSEFSAFVAKVFLTTPYACMVNILFGREVIPEFLQENCTVSNMTQFLENAGEFNHSQARELRKMLTKSKN